MKVGNFLSVGVLAEFFPVLTVAANRLRPVSGTSVCAVDLSRSHGRSSTASADGSAEAAGDCSEKCDVLEVAVRGLVSREPVGAVR